MSNFRIGMAGKQIETGHHQPCFQWDENRVDLSFLISLYRCINEIVKVNRFF